MKRSEVLVPQLSPVFCASGADRVQLVWARRLLVLRDGRASFAAKPIALLGISSV